MDVGQETTGGASPGAALSANDNLRPGQKLGRYVLLSPVAQGGMARVWAARQVGIRGFQKVVAIKTITPALAADAEFERMFLDEARIAAAIHHPNVAEILDLGEVGSVLFLAMEWVDGVSLLTLLKARPRVPLPDPIAVRIIADACAGLHAAHELRGEHGEALGVVHRDVSPHNILVSQDGNVKVADFGVAKAMGLEHAPTVAGQLKGKVAYMSPEQAKGDVAVDRRSDIFSLGAVLYECVTGQRAWAGANDVARLQNLLAGNIIPPRQVRTDLPQDLENILAYCLAVDPARRFQTADQLRVALEQFLVTRKLVVSPTDVGAYVQSLCGRELDDRRARIRHASAVFVDDGGVAGIPQSYSGVSVQARGRGMRRSTATAITFVSGGITVAGLLGIVAVGSLPPAAATAVPAASSAQPVAPVAGAGTVTVVPTPADALVEVNGVVLGPGRRSFSRPNPGEMHKVVVRAQGYEPATITIDHQSPNTQWTVELTKLPSADVSASAAPATSTPPASRPPTPATAENKTPRPTPVATPPATTPGKGGRPGKPPAIPQNPF